MSVNEQLAEELHKVVIKKFKGRKAYSRFKNNNWAADLAEMESLPSKNKNVKYLFDICFMFYVIRLFSFIRLYMFSL